MKIGMVNNAWNSKLSTGIIEQIDIQHHDIPRPELYLLGLFRKTRFEKRNWKTELKKKKRTTRNEYQTSKDDVRKTNFNEMNSG